MDDQDVLKHFESGAGARRRLGAEGAEAAARPGPAAARHPCGVRRARALPSAVSALAAEAGMIRPHRRRISAPSRDRRVTRNPLPWKRVRAHAHRALVGLDARRVEVEAHVELTVPGFTIVGRADRACAEAKHHLRSGMISAELEWPLRRIMVNDASHSSRARSSPRSARRTRAARSDRRMRSARGRASQQYWTGRRRRTRHIRRWERPIPPASTTSSSRSTNPAPSFSRGVD
jgi:hypothetical protein